MITVPGDNCAACSGCLCTVAYEVCDRTP